MRVGARAGVVRAVKAVGLPSGSGAASREAVPWEAGGPAPRRGPRSMMLDPDMARSS